MKEKNKSLGINALLNVVKSSLSIIFPLITYPYLYQILHSENMGKINFATSISSYFSMLAMLGVTQYAIREGAKIRNDNAQLNKFVSEVFTINVVTTVISYFLLICTLIFVNKLRNYTELILICSISIVFTVLGIEYVNIIFEDYLYITIRSIIINIISLILIFLFVKKETDIYIYAFLSIFSNAFMGISNWIYCRKYIKIHLTREVHIRRHFKPISILFANALATNIYVNLDITMLGWISGDYYVGIYSLAVKIYSVIKNIMAALYAATVPRISLCIEKKNDVEVRKIYTNLVCAILLLLIPTSMGIVATAPELVSIIGGGEYEDAILSLKILGGSLVGAIGAGLLTYCLNIPLRREKINFQATILSASINFVLNIFFIAAFKQNGAAVTTLISEFCVLGYCAIKGKEVIKKYLDCKRVISDCILAIIGAFIVACVSWIIHGFIKIKYICLLLIIVFSMFFYSILLIAMKWRLLVCILKKKRKIK